MSTSRYKDSFFVPLIWTFSIVVPVLVGIMLTPDLLPKIDLGLAQNTLARLNAIFNSGVSLLLVLGFVGIRLKRIRWHRALMLSAFALSALFLVSYVLQHLSWGSVAYCETARVGKGIYYTVLLSHIGLSVTIIPLASFSIYRALSERFDRHRKLARITFPLWLYVSITGVLVYWFIAPCYGT